MAQPTVATLVERFGQLFGGGKLPPKPEITKAITQNKQVQDWLKQTLDPNLNPAMKDSLLDEIKNEVTKLPAFKTVALKPLKGKGFVILNFEKIRQFFSVETKNHDLDPSKFSQGGSTDRTVLQKKVRELRKFRLWMAKEEVEKYPELTKKLDKPFPTEPEFIPYLLSQVALDVNLAKELWDVLGSLEYRYDFIKGEEELKMNLGFITTEAIPKEDEKKSCSEFYCCYGSLGKEFGTQRCQWES